MKHSYVQFVKIADDGHVMRCLSEKGVCMCVQCVGCVCGCGVYVGVVCMCVYVWCVCVWYVCVCGVVCV